MEVRKFWKTGRKKGTYLTSLPRDWVESGSNNSTKLCIAKVSVRKRREETHLVLSHLLSDVDKIELEVKAADKKALEYEIISAYVKGYDEVRVSFSKSYPECIKHLYWLKTRLDGLDVKRDPLSKEYVVRIKTEPKSLKELFNDIYLRYQESYGICLELMEGIYARKNIIEIAKEKKMDIECTEDDIDRLSFLTKRLINQFLNSRIDQETLAIKEIDDVLQLQTINANLERLGDLQLEIYKQLNELCKEPDLEKIKEYFKPCQRKETIQDYGFTDYYKDANRMVEEAFSSALGNELNPELLIKVIRTKDENSEYFEKLDKEVRGRLPYITPEQRAQILIKVDDSRVYRLGCLEHMIWGITGNATNIAEALFNIHGPGLL